MKTFLLKNMITSNRKTSKSINSLMMVLALLLSAVSFGQNVSATWGTNASTAWYTTGNWIGGAYAGVQGAATSNANVATFTNGSTGNPIGINMGTNSLNLGSIVIDNSRTAALNITNSSGTAGVLRLYGTTVNSIANTVVRHNGSGLLTLQTTNTMGIVLSNTTNNIFQIDNTGGIAVASIMSGANPLTKGGTGAGVMTLTGANTYTGLTTVSGGTLKLNRTGGTTIPNSNSIVVGNGATMIISTAQQLANVTVDAGGILELGATLTVSGTATINGTLRIASGGYAQTTGGGTYTYGSNGTLEYLLTSGGAYNVTTAHAYWPASNGPANVTINCSGGTSVNMNAGMTRSVPSSGTTGTFLLVAGANAVAGTALTLNGTVQINGGNFATTPTYGSSSTLIYNTTYGTSNEWTGGASTSVAAGSGIPANVTIQSGNVTLAGGRGVPGNVTVNTGATLTLNATAGDLYLGGNFAQNGTLTNNNRAVFFVLGNAQSINTSGSSVTFSYLLIDKTGGSTVTLSKPVTVSNTLTLTAGFIDLGTNDLTAGATASASATSYIKTTSTGQLRQVVAGSAKIFPVGNSAYNPITLTNSGTSDTYGINEIDGTLPNANDATLTVDRRWVVTEAVAGGGNLAVVAQYNTGEPQANFAAGTTPYLGLYSGSWTAVAATLAGANPFTASSNSNFTNSITGSSSYFAIGKDTGLITGVTPPIITSFAASPNNGSATSGYVGSTITLTGTGFTGVTVVNYNGSGGTSVGSFSVVNDTTLTFAAPAGMFGTIYVLNSAGNYTSASSFTNLGYITAATGTWQTPGTWLGGSVPPSTTTTDITIAHDVTGTTGTTDVGRLTVNTGVTLTNTAAATISVNTASTNSGTVTTNGSFGTSVTYTNSGTFNVGNGGNFQINQGGYYAGTAIVYNATASSLTFNNATGQYGISNSHTYWPASNGPVTVNINGAGGAQLQTGATRTVGNLNTSAGFDVQASGGLTVNGILTINSGGAITGNAPIYGSSSSLVYNTTSNPYNVGTEWTGNSTTAGTGVPNNVTIQNTNNVTTPATARGLAGNLTISSGATLTLSSTLGGDLNVHGNWTNSGTFVPASRLVTLNGTAAQTLTGATTFDYLTLNNSNGLTLQASSAVTVNQTLALTSGKITLGANNFTIGASGSITGASSTNYIVTNGAGQLRRTVNNTNVTFAVGNSAYNPITFNNSGTTDVYGVVVADGALTTGLNNDKTVSRRWIVTEAVAGGSNLSVVAQYNTGEENTNYNAGTNPYIGFYNGTSWTQTAATLAGSNPFTATSGSNLSPADLSTGIQYFAVGKDNAFYSIATNLVVTAITPSSPTAGSAFTVTVRSQDAYGSFTNVVANTDFTLSTNGNAGAIGGTITGTIVAGTSTIVVSGVTLATAGTGATITATRTAGDVLAAGTSAGFNVLDAASKLALVSVPSSGTVGVAIGTFTVEALRPDNSLDTTFNGTVTITKASGPGTLSGTNSVAAVGGIATFSTSTFSAAGIVTITASSGALTPATSGNITINLVPGSIFANPITGTNPNTSNPYTTGQTVDSNLTVSGIGRGSAITGTSANDRYTANSWDTVSLDSDAYFYFTLTPDTGYTINFSDFTYTGQRSGSGPTSFVFRSSLDGYTADIGSPTATGTTISLSGATYDDVDEPITFRIYGYGASASGGTFSVNDFDFEGNVVCLTPKAFTVTGTGTYCSGSTGLAVGLSDSQVGVNYQLKLGGTDVGSPVAGTGNAISFGDQTAGTYTVEATNTNSPCSTSATMTGSAVVTLNNATTWTGGTDTVWTEATNWSCGVPLSTSDVTIGTGTFQPEIVSSPSIGSLTINSGATLKVMSTHNLTITGAIVNNGTLTVQNNANLIQSADVSNTGSGTNIVNRSSASIMRQDYTLWSSPVVGQQLQAFSPATLSNRFYTYDSANDIYVAETATNNFTEGIGYLIRVANNHPITPTIWNGVFTGSELHNGDVDIATTSGLYYGIGNPYPSTISADDFIDDNGLTDALYFWRKTNNPDQINNPTSSYATYTYAGGVGNGDPNPDDPLALEPNGFIQVGQGFIAQAAGSQLSFTNAHRVANNGNQFLRTAEVERHRIWLNLSNSVSGINKMMVAYMTGATQGVDAAIDGRFFQDTPTALNSFLNNEEFAIQGRALPFESSDVVPLAFKAVNAGTFTIAIDHVDGLFEGAQDIYLKDNVTTVVHDLKASPYTFATETGAFNNRFEIVYSPLLAVEQPVFNENSVVVYKQNLDIVINSGKVNMANVKVFDIRGRLIVEKDNINAAEVKLSAGTTNQVLIVKITADNNATVTKKVVN